MSIISMISVTEGQQYPEGSYSDLRWSKQAKQPIVCRETHKGLCLSEFERNGYDDSDFYMVVWNEELGQPETKMFATTRGWSYPCMDSHVDATDEVRAKYDAHVAAAKRRESIQRRWSKRARLNTEAAITGLTRSQVERIRAQFTRDDADTLIDLLRIRHGNGFRSDFRRSLADQLHAWIMDPAPKYRSPFSAKQWQCLTRW